MPSDENFANALSTFCKKGSKCTSGTMQANTKVCKQSDHQANDTEQTPDENIEEAVIEICNLTLRHIQGHPKDALRTKWKDKKQLMSKTSYSHLNLCEN